MFAGWSYHGWHCHGDVDENGTMHNATVIDIDCFYREYSATFKSYQVFVEYVKSKGF